MDREDIFKKRMTDLQRMAYDKEIVTYTPFLSLHELHMVNSMKEEYPSLSREASGGYEFAERQMVAFIPDALSYEWEFPITCVKLLQTDAKYAGKLTHRDYLGALMNLGIERSTLGDILIQDNLAYVFCQERMAAYIMENLYQVKHSSVRSELVVSKVELPRPKFQDIQGTVSSIRLDSLIALAFNESRSRLVREIESGNVYVNGRQIISNGHHVDMGDIVSVRGKGRFLVKEIIGRTKKGRTMVLLQKYI